MSEQLVPRKRFSPLAIWAMSFGCAVGWGAFVMPGTTFLPMAGPLGSSLALLLGGLAMMVIAANYHFMAQRHSGPGGAFGYVRAVLGADHAFLCAWFLWLVYAAVSWANASAFVLLVRNFFGDALQFGFHYTLAGYDIHMGEVLLSAAVIVGAGLLCMLRNRTAVALNTALAVALLAGSVGCFAVISNGLDSLAELAPPFMPGRSAAFQIFNVLALAPWAYVGFEAVSHVTGEMTCCRRSLFWLMAAGVLAAVFAYVALILVAAMPLQGLADWGDYATWTEAATPSGGQARMVDLPVFKAVAQYLGPTGMKVLGLAIIGGVGTGMVGCYIALSRLTCAMADDGILPRWFARRTERNIPRNALLFIMGASLLVSFTGRTAIGWIVDINSICATIAYTYVSVCAFSLARREGSRLFRATGAAGILLGIAFCIFTALPNIWSIGSLPTESYFIFSLWGVLGFVFFLNVFRRDTSERYGRSTFVWLVMLFFIFVSSLMWMRQEVHETSSVMVARVSEYHAQRAGAAQVSERHAPSDKVHDVNAFLQDAMDTFSRGLVKHSLIQMLLIMVSIGVVFAVYSLMHTRRRQVELEKLKAEEVSRSKSAFLSNMSHDIRTPMNAIIGFTDLALTKTDIAAVHDYLHKIKLSSNHLLSLINDVLEMSRIESGKVELQPAPVSIPELLHNLSTIIIGQVEAKQHELDINALNVRNENVLCDKLRLNQILLNLLSNAIKYTPAGGRISVSIRQLSAAGGCADYELRVKDNGLGMSREFAAHIFESFTREQTDDVNKIQGTGLGMAITKHLVDIMGGTIRVETEKGKGSEFILNFRFPVAEQDAAAADTAALKHVHALVADDDYTACEAITDMLSDMGVRAEWTMSGKEALLRHANAKNRNDPFTLCIIDWKMPDMSGVHVAREITAAAGATPPAMVLVTAYDWLNIRDEAAAAGVRAFCNKPVFASELRAAILAALGGQEQKKGKEDAAEVVDFSGRRVLLVDDMEVNREIGAAMLTMSGIEVEQATDGAEAVAMVEKAEPGHYDVVLMDVQMPKMNGYEATRAIRALADEGRAGVPIVAMTANAFDEDRQAALDAGMNGHLAKPIDMEKLFAMLREIL
ncbi:amino acid permease [uncultured Desulfovibrio sp.]|uniref:amino acid permease n=1 Tax=uncultured Desulfovibrio sp. TaxID=167968 RepID=UPI002608C651|nr:amino acid permease [uncultured Desulfovibrio sp.]